MRVLSGLLIPLFATCGVASTQVLQQISTLETVGMPGKVGIVAKSGIVEL